MSRPRRSVEQEWFDVFADWTLDDQEIALKILAESHRQAIRQDRRRKQRPFETPAVPAEQQPEEKETDGRTGQV